MQPGSGRVFVRLKGELRLRGWEDKDSWRADRGEFTGEVKEAGGGSNCKGRDLVVLLVADIHEPAIGTEGQMTGPAAVRPDFINLCKSAIATDAEAHDGVVGAVCGVKVAATRSDHDL